MRVHDDSMHNTQDVLEGKGQVRRLTLLDVLRMRMTHQLHMHDLYACARALRHY
jgi:hypothetical protein